MQKSDVDVLLSVVILTKNSSANIRACLDSVLFADEIIIVDDCSDDDTKEIIKEYQVKTSYDLTIANQNCSRIHVFERDLKQDFAAARNFGKMKGSSRWVLFLDSDEWVSDKLQQEILEHIKDKQERFTGFLLRRQDSFMGKQLNYGETSSVRFLRLGRRMLGQRGIGLWHGKVHETWKLPPPHKELTHPLLHERGLSITAFMQRLDRYSSLQADQWYAEGKKEPFIYIFLKPGAKFMYNYLFRLGFLDGFPGLAFAFCMSWHSLLVRVKLRLLNQNHGKKYIAMPHPSS